MSTPHLAATLARSQASLMAGSKREGAAVLAATKAELARLDSVLAVSKSSYVYTALVAKRGRLQAAVAALS
jgi:hypothetical protein